MSDREVLPHQSTLPADHPTRRNVPTLIHDSRAWVPAESYDTLWLALARIVGDMAAVRANLERLGLRFEEAEPDG